MDYFLTGVSNACWADLPAETKLAIYDALTILGPSFNSQEISNVIYGSLTIILAHKNDFIMSLNNYLPVVDCSECPTRRFRSKLKNQSKEISVESALE